MGAFESGVVGKGMDLVQSWCAGVTRLKRCETELENAKRELELIERALGAWMSPDDVCTGESFNIWVGDGLLKVTAGVIDDSVRRYVIVWRKRPSAKCATEMRL